MLACAALQLVPAVASAGIVLGPGDVNVQAGAGSYDILAVDLNKPATLSEGSYVASLFNYQFTLIPGFLTRGTITPVLLTGNGTDYTPIAVGDTITFSGATSFVSVDFGGSDSFTLLSSAEVFPGLYWETGGPEPRMPIGYAGRQRIRALSGCERSGGRHADRRRARGLLLAVYDFSIEVNEVAAVPAPPTLVMALAGAGLWTHVAGRSTVTPGR